MQIVDIVLPIVYIVVGLAIVWFIIELAMTVRKTRQTVGDIKKSIDPAIKNVEQITEQVKPIVQKVDPLVERVSLTVDAANLEIMRVDEILEDVGQITGSVTKTMDTVENVTSAPIDLVTSFTSKIRAKFKPKAASEESISLGEPTESSADQNPIVGIVDNITESANEAIADVREARAEKKASNEDKYVQSEADLDKQNVASSKITEKVLEQVGEDTDAQSAN